MSTETQTQKESIICRTCLNVIKGGSFRLHENSGLGRGLKYTHILRYIVPELYLGLSQGPEICYKCKESLRIAYTFRKKCLDTETLIGNYLKNVRCTAQAIDLVSVIDYLKVYQMQQNILSEWNDDDFHQIPVRNELSGSSTNLEPNAELNITANSEVSEITSIDLTLPRIPEVDMTSIVAIDKIPPIIANDKIPPIIANDKIRPIITNDKIPPIIAKKVRIPRDPKKFHCYLPAENIQINKQKEADKENSKTSPVERLSLVPIHQLQNPQQQSQGNKENSSKEVIQTEPPQQEENIQQQSQYHRVEVLKVCTETGLFKNKAGRYFNMSGQILSDDVVKSVREEGTMNVPIIKERKRKLETEKSDNSNSVSVLEKSDSAKQIKLGAKTVDKGEKQHCVEENSINVCEEMGLLQNQVEAEKKQYKIRVREPTELLINKNSLNVCEETGLLKDQNGHYFDFSGKPIENSQVEDEKKKAKIRGETLFKISNICTVTDEDFDINKSQLNKCPSDFEENINAHQIKKQVYGGQSKHQNKNTDKINSENVDFSSSAPVTPVVSSLVKNRNPTIIGSCNNSLLKTNTSKPPMNILNFTADKNLRIPQQSNPALHVFKETKPTHCYVNKNAGNKESTENNTQTDYTSNDNPPVLIKEEPLDVSEYVNNENESSTDETLSAPDLAAENVLDSWQNLINPLDPCENQYVDVPDFVQINKLYIEDVEPCACKNTSEETSTNSSCKNSTRNKLKIVLKKENGLQQKISFKGKVLVKSKSGYELKNVTSTEKSVPSNTMPSGKRRKIDVNMPKASAERVRECRARKKLLKQQKPPAKTAAQRNREYRVWQKSLKNAAVTIGENDSPSTSFSGLHDLFTVNPDNPQPTTSREDVKKLCPKEPDAINKEEPILNTNRQNTFTNSLPDRQVCVLFTNYTEDGVYVNDHDYLTAPYIRNNLLVDYKNESYCLCFICSSKHLLVDHIEHMKAHDSNCAQCKVNLGTSYMLNLHMKGHSKPCKYCTDIVAFSDYEKHVKKHIVEEKMIEEEDSKKMSKEQVRDDMEFRIRGGFSKKYSPKSKARKKQNSRSLAKTERREISAINSASTTNLDSLSRKMCQKGDDRAEEASKLPTVETNQVYSDNDNKSIINNKDDETSIQSRYSTRIKTKNIKRERYSEENRTHSSESTNYDKNIDGTIESDDDCINNDTCSPSSMSWASRMRTRRKRIEDETEEKISPRRVLRSTFKKKEDKNLTSEDINVCASSEMGIKIETETNCIVQNENEEQKMDEANNESETVKAI